MNEIIEFTVRSKEKDVVEINGYVYVDEIDDEAPLHFYDQFGVECGQQVPSNPYSENTLGGYDSHVDYELLSSRFQSDDMFLQYLYDYKDDGHTEIDREDYILEIN